MSLMLPLVCVKYDVRTNAIIPRSDGARKPLWDGGTVAGDESWGLRSSKRWSRALARLSGAAGEST
jgi:hypothetical protein